MSSSTPRERLPVTTSRDLNPTPEAIKRFWSNVVKGPDDQCWIWVGPISTPDGYGRFSWQVARQRRTLSAHRFALLIARGEELPSRAVGEHYCCEPLCVRVDDKHLRIATQQENIEWAVFRGRHVGNRPGAGSDHRAQRSQRVREAVRDGWNAQRLIQARSDLVPHDNQLPLW